MITTTVSIPHNSTFRPNILRFCFSHLTNLYLLHLWTAVHMYSCCCCREEIELSCVIWLPNGSNSSTRHNDDKFSTKQHNSRVQTNCTRYFTFGAPAISTRVFYMNNNSWSPFNHTPRPLSAQSICFYQFENTERWYCYGTQLTNTLNTIQQTGYWVGFIGLSQIARFCSLLFLFCLI